MFTGLIIFIYNSFNVDFYMFFKYITNIAYIIILPIPNLWYFSKY